MLILLKLVKGSLNFCLYLIDVLIFEVIQEESGLRVKGISIERAAAMTYWEYAQSVRRFQKIMEVIGIDQALRDAGIKAGDIVLIGENELEWED